MSRREKILDRIEKLLALARDKRGNEHEAAAAAAAAAKLIAEHHIEEAELPGEEAASEIVEAVERDLFGDERDAQGWRRVLAHAIAESLSCITFRGKDKKLWIVGRATDRQGCSLIYRYLCEELERLAAEYAGEKMRKSSLGMLYPELTSLLPTRGGLAESSFCWGAADVIRERLEQTRRLSAPTQEELDARDATADAKTLVLMKRRAEVHRFAAETMKLHRTSVDVDVNPTADAAGRIAGRSIPLGPASSGPRRLGSGGSGE